MMVNRPQAKMAAKNCMRTARVSPYQIGLVYILILFALSIFEQVTLSLFGDPTYMDYLGTYVMQPTSINMFISILILLISALLEAGFATYCLGVRRGLVMPLQTLFDGFSMAGKVIALDIVQIVLISLWMLLFFFPGIIAMYRYRFALYNLLENPDIGVMEAIARSKQQTRGHKWELFILDLSFLGWNLLNYCTMGFLGIWLTPYYVLTDIAFYDTICASMDGSAGQGGWPGSGGGNGQGGWNSPYGGQNGPYYGQNGSYYGGQNGPYGDQSGPYGSQGWNGQNPGAGQNGQNNGWNSQIPAAPEPPRTPPEFPQPPAAPDVPRPQDWQGGDEPEQRS